jgi:hypothetical protein
VDCVRGIVFFVGSGSVNLYSKVGGHRMTGIVSVNGDIVNDAGRILSDPSSLILNSFGLWTPASPHSS